jgi:hypothetical protein
MTSPASRQQCADANGVYWANTVFSVVFQEHPGASATVGMFTYQAVGKSGPNSLQPVAPSSDPRYPLRYVVSSTRVPVTSGVVDVDSRAPPCSLKATPWVHQANDRNRSNADT